jgi:hypothetical protein
MKKRHSIEREIKDFVMFPLRAVTIFHEDKWGVSSLASERFGSVAREVTGPRIERGMEEEEDYYLPDVEIVERLSRPDLRES